MGLSKDREKKDGPGRLVDDACEKRTDIYSPAKRSEVMSRVRGSNTGPERLVRSLLHRMGFRFRLDRRDLPGRPDVTLPRFRSAIFVHGCFWHQHPGCRKATIPKTRSEWWSEKLGRNRERDEETYGALRSIGWRPFIVWECELVDLVRLERRLRRFLS